MLKITKCMSKNSIKVYDSDILTQKYPYVSLSPNYETVMNKIDARQIVYC